MLIEKCEISGLKEIKKLINKMWPSKTLKDIKKSLESDKEIILVAKNKQECIMIGFLHGIIKNDYIEGVLMYPAMYIEGLFVSEDNRNKNVASLLIASLTDYCKQHGIKQIASECRDTNQKSYNLHIKNSFTVYSKSVHFIKNI